MAEIDPLMKEAEKVLRAMKKSNKVQEYKIDYI